MQKFKAVMFLFIIMLSIYLSGCAFTTGLILGEDDVALMEGSNLYKNKQYKEAALKYQESIAKALDTSEKKKSDSFITWDIETGDTLKFLTKDKKEPDYNTAMTAFFFLGLCQQELDQPEEAKKSFLSSIKVANEINTSRSRVFAISPYNSIGWVYAGEKDYTAANKTFDEILGYMKTNNIENPEYKNMVFSNYAIILFTQDEIEKAKSFFERSYQLYHENKLSEKASTQFFTFYIDFLINTNNLGKAKKAILEMEKVAPEGQKQIEGLGYNLISFLDIAKGSIALHEGNFDEAKRRLNSAKINLVDFDSDNAKLYLAYVEGLYYESENEFTKAKKNYAVAKEMARKNKNWLIYNRVASSIARLH